MGLARLLRELDYQKREVGRLGADVAKLEVEKYEAVRLRAAVETLEGEKAQLSFALQQAQCALAWSGAQWYHQCGGVMHLSSGTHATHAHTPTKAGVHFSVGKGTPKPQRRARFS